MDQYALGTGESTSIALAKQEKVRLIFTDDLEAREAASIYGLESRTSWICFCHGTPSCKSRERIARTSKISYADRSEDLSSNHVRGGTHPILISVIVSITPG